MQIKNKWLRAALLVLVLALLAYGYYAKADAPAPAGDTGALTPVTAAPEESAPPDGDGPLAEDGVYTTKEDVALYLHSYGRLPANFITKAEAEKAGWSGGSLEKVLPGKCIGGDRFGNYEKLLPDAPGRTWYECDVNTFGNYEKLLPDAPGRTWYECDVNTLGAKSRGPERLVFSSDGLIYYTGDHYKSFTQLY